jgi:uncharacterized LabA/DUF88 family protein
MKNQEKVQIFIDGGNFHHLLLKKLKLKELDFSFDDFAKFLADGRIITEAGKRYYIGTVREQEDNTKSKESMAQQQKLFAQLWSSGWQTKTSKLRFREEKVIIDDRTVDYKKILKKGIKQIEYHRFREKGIDVKIATDLIIGALDNKYDTAILVSSDTDLIPAIDIVRKRFKKRVEYVGFSIIDETAQQEDSKSSIGMITKSDIQRILVKSDIDNFIKEKLI